MGLVARGEFHSLGLYVNLLGQELDQREQGADDIYTYLAVILASDGRDGAERYTKVVVCSFSDHLPYVERREQRVAIH